MQNEDKKWIKWVIFALICGFLIGGTIKKILSIFLTAPIFEIILVAIIPACMILGLLIVLYKYNKEKEDLLTHQ